MISLSLVDMDSFGMIPRRLLNLLDTEEEKARHLRPAEKRRFLLTRIALRQSLTDVAGGDPSSWRFIVGETGKVSLAHSYGRPFVEFSISHSSHVLAVAVSTSGPIGVDLEKASSSASSSNEEFFPQEQFSTREKQYLEQTSVNERWRETLKLWTRKEACSKFFGLGLNLDFSKLDVLADRGHQPGLDIETQEVSIAGESYFLSLALRTRTPKTIDIRSRDLFSCASG